MSELLYLKDIHVKEFIERLFVAYRESFADPKKTLDSLSLGTAHNKALLLISLYNGITISDLLKKLKITKQSLNRVLKDLDKSEYIIFKKDQQDTRVKHIFLTEEGNIVYQKIFEIQKKRIYKVLLNSSSEEVTHFNKIIKELINEKI
ncbi:MAG: MarR family transcriptional regulator [Candidatus Pelagibacter sp. TMED275]|nr:MAG: MarR family transcriptional regulator [Candidatus Pelagibacter sp. TMED275]